MILQSFGLRKCRQYNTRLLVLSDRTGDLKNAETIEAGIKAGKGDTNAAIPLLEEGISFLNAIKPIS